MMDISGARAFDFVFGNWLVHNRKLRDVADRDCDEWVEFDARSEVFPILGGQGHIDRMFAPDPPDGPPFEGFTLRLYNPAEDAWRIWWSSTRAPGILEPPVIGRFAGDQGIFECDDIVRGTPIKVRFGWRAHHLIPVWSQSFSYDAGRTWSQNWEMRFDRVDAS
jgi:hypothetical protein